MRTISNVMPKSFEIELLPNGLCDIVFAGNLEQHLIQNIETQGDEDVISTSEIEYVYDLYRMRVPYSDNLENRIEENYSVWYDHAKKIERDSIVEQKTAEVNAACQETIYSGIDVETEQYGMKHYSLTLHDQQNISAISVMVGGGVQAYPYHADGESCMMYTASDLMRIVEAATVAITYHTTYCNLLKVWIKRETDNDVLQSIYYGCELPEDLKKTMESLIMQ